MSRSYKKSPVFKDSQRKRSGETGTGEQKRFASRAVRRNDDAIANGGSYRKLYDSYSICDYRFIETENEFRKEWESGSKYLHNRFKTYKQALLYWKKRYRFK